MAYIKANLVDRFVRVRDDVIVTIVAYDMVDNSTDPVTVIASGRDAVIVTNATAEELAAVKSVIAKALVLAAG